MGCFGSDKQYTDKPQWFDPLGPDAAGKQSPTGGPEQRAGIYSQISSLYPQAQQSSQQLVTGLKTASQDPGFAAGADQARKTINGGYLGGAPEFNQALSKFQAGTGKAVSAVKQGALASSVDSTADMRSRFGRAGLGFSTGNEQAAQATQAAGAARANELGANIQQGANQMEANARTQNYGQERMIQQQGTKQLQDANAAPLQYLSQIPSSLYAPSATQAQIVSGLSGGGPIATPQSNIVRQPGVYDYALGTLGAM